MPDITIIFLNGTSSSGKSTLAQHLQQILEEPFLHANADAIKEMSVPAPLDERGERFARFRFMPSVYAAIPSCFAMLASFGNNLIVEDVTRPLQLRNYVEAFTAYAVLFVGVYCSPEELERRKRERGDRRIGRAREQLQQGLVHACGPYDLEVDTSQQTIEACALQIRQRLQTGPPPTAFHRLAQIPLEALWQKTEEIDRVIYLARHPELQRKTWEHERQTLTEELSKAWPDGVSVVDVVSEMRR